MGFMADLKDKYDKEENILMKATVEDLKNFGMIPEFLGRSADPVFTGGTG